MCQQINDFVTSPLEFCEILGFKVGAEENCYDGVPSKIKLEKKEKKREKITKENIDQVLDYA